MAENISKQILIVDDDLALLETLSAFLTDRQHSYGVLTAGSAEEALDKLGREEIFLVVSDIRLPGMSGLALQSEIRSCFPQVDVILMTGFGTPEILKEAEEAGCCHALNKHFPPQQLADLIERMENKQTGGFAGTLKNIQLNDLIQMCCLSMVTIAIRVRKEAHDGRIYIEDGRIVHAECGELAGESAFYAILGWESGSFETLSVAATPPPTIEKNWQYLLMEAAHIADENAASVDEKAPTTEELDIGPDLFDDPRQLRVLVVDDSTMMCRILGDLLAAEGDIEVVGTAQNGEEALSLIDQLRPDLITLDVNMPVMDGNTALKHIMIRNPCPVVIISNVGERSQDQIIDFLRLGAVDFIRKPRSEDMAEQQGQVLNRIRKAASARIGNFQRVKLPKKIPTKAPMLDEAATCPLLVTICSGAGGYAELIRLLPRLPGNLPAAVVVFQAMPTDLAIPLADYLNRISALRVAPVRSGEPLTAGNCYLCPDHLPLNLTAAQGGAVLTLQAAASGAAEGDGCLGAFLTSAGPLLPPPLLVLLSGAGVAPGDAALAAGDRLGKLIAQEPGACLVPDPIEDLMAAGIRLQIGDGEKIVQQILYFTRDHENV